MLKDPYTDEVPGTVVLLTTSNEPLGIQPRLSRDRRASTMPQQVFELKQLKALKEDKKRTNSGKVILEPQPDDSPNDPLNWSAWRRDAALFSLGIYCMVGGGITPMLAAGFKQVAATYKVKFSDVALTTGLYMMGLGVGGVLMSPTAIVFGKRPVYLISSLVCMLTSIWCSASPTFTSLAAARVFQGISVSPVECLPSATIAEIFFLHERAYRIGIYGLLLLGGKNIMPLVSAAIIQAYGWRWVFRILAIVVGLCTLMLFFFTPETFWDRTPRPASLTQASLLQRWQSLRSSGSDKQDRENGTSQIPSQKPGHHHHHVGSAEPHAEDLTVTRETSGARRLRFKTSGIKLPANQASPGQSDDLSAPGVPHLHNLNSPYYSDLERNDTYFAEKAPLARSDSSTVVPRTDGSKSPHRKGKGVERPDTEVFPRPMRYTTKLINAPTKSYHKTLKVFNGRLTDAN